MKYTDTCIYMHMYNEYKSVVHVIYLKFQIWLNSNELNFSSFSGLRNLLLNYLHSNTIYRVSYFFKEEETETNVCVSQMWLIIF